MSEPESVAAFVRAYGRSLFGTAYLLTGDGDAAEDLVQDTLSLLLPKWSRVSGARSPVAYARRALTNRFIDGRRGAASDRVGRWELPDGIQPDSTDSVIDRQVLWQLLGRLPANQRAALVLRYFHDETDDEIGRALGCRTATVRSLRSRGLETLRRLADDEHETQPPKRMGRT